MFNSKEYYVKDIMKLYGITRETIKYYESCGLIESRRAQNRYRVFDELNVRKLRRILALRNLGLTVEDILQHFQCETADERMAIMESVRERTEKEILELNQRLRRIHDWERVAYENRRFRGRFNVGYDLTFCVDCPHITSEDRHRFNVFYVMELSMTAEEGIINIRDCEMVKNVDLGKRCCRDCPKKQYFKEYYRCNSTVNNEEELKELLGRGIHDLTMQGRQVHSKAYILRKVIQKDGKDVMDYNILLPLEN